MLGISTPTHLDNMPDILEKLKGGDLRSIGQANEVAKEVEKNPSLFKALFNGLFHDDPVVRMRSADAIEKVTQHRPELLATYTSNVISLLASATQQEVCWHLAQIAPRLSYNARQEKEILVALKRYLNHRSKSVRVSALDSLTLLAEKNSSLLDEITSLVHHHVTNGSPAVQSRGKKLLKRLDSTYLHRKS